ncbi:ParB N-terminal domain-containing protein [Ruegeria sp. HKCCD8929]|uniref:ParB/RepB/Spo0J family partition protein n=1 Tax=Ruegeria sp. HKCCD8929 TaxID=2683006 RepID=UPI0014880466|nr:ParB N-terminal domain-containing protein [Ruegeria sp. HKCCD8929]
MSSNNKFGFTPIDETDLNKPRRREVGPMGAAVRETANNLHDSTENLVEQRRQNAADAKEFRRAREEGRILVTVKTSDIHTDDLPRDRLDLSGVAHSDEMDELKSSIYERGQKEPIELYVDRGGRYQLKKGWRRLTALQQLYQETGDKRFTDVVARVSDPQKDRIDLYVDMVEENVIREDLTFAEMAQVAIIASRDQELDASDAEALVGRLYSSLHKMKRSYIRSFVLLLNELGDALMFPKAVSRNLGVEVVRKMRADPQRVEKLRESLASAGSAEDQNRMLEAFLGDVEVETADTKSRGKKESVKYEFHVGASKVTARNGECRILSDHDFSAVDRGKLQKAVEAFEAVLREE